MAVPLLLCGIGILFAMCAACFYRMGAADWSDEKKFLIDSLESLASENAKLRELVGDCMAVFSLACHDYGCRYERHHDCWDECELVRRARELGIEVE